MHTQRVLSRESVKLTNLPSSTDETVRAHHHQSHCSSPVPVSPAKAKAHTSCCRPSRLATNPGGVPVQVQRMLVFAVIITLLTVFCVHRTESFTKQRRAVRGSSSAATAVVSGQDLESNTAAVTTVSRTKLGAYVPTKRFTTQWPPLAVPPVSLTAGTSPAVGWFGFRATF